MGPHMQAKRKTTPASFPPHLHSYLTQRDGATLYDTSGRGALRERPHCTGSHLPSRALVLLCFVWLGISVMDVMEKAPHFLRRSP